MRYRNGHNPWNKGIKKATNKGKSWFGLGQRAKTGIDNNKWKGDKASYYAKHLWVAYWFGTPKQCEHCGTNKARRYEWSNISGKYKRERQDWERLCVSCHRIKDHWSEKAHEAKRRKHDLLLFN